ncbi:hypothetical protein MVES1_002441 [Malassezia vespertilionis]|uniref:uncharacterized protein n=1 Tax=Malassezia vespertilionis TaxID=2020962 RepID=UPI0024B0B8F9|nr:uncharacterized protein MVES1_002441 [Malassezia vespertilionis]WFD07085.1 hypothetical protein MVES1_002441 [Malassezia vespertilionis]
MTEAPKHATLQTGIPVYAIGFSNDMHIFYVGGGGAGRSGVSNAIKSAKLQRGDNALTLHPAGEFKLRGDEDAPMCVTVSPSSDALVVGINSAADIVRGGENRHLRVYDFGVQASPGARAEGQADLHVDIRERSALASLGMADPEQYQKTVSFSPDGKLLAVGSSDGRLQLHRYPSLEPVWSSTQDTFTSDEEIYDTDFSQDGTQLACTTQSKVVVLSTSPRTKEKGGVLTYTPRILQTIDSATIGTSERGAFRMAKFGRTKTMDVGTRDMLFTLVNTAPSKDAKARPSYIVAWNADKWQITAIRKVSQRPATVLTVSPDGRFVACGMSDLNHSSSTAEN